LLAALGDLGFEFNEARDGDQLEVLGDSSATRQGNEKVDIVVLNCTDFGIGLRKEGDEYIVIADWFNIELGGGPRRKEFAAQLQQRYAYHVVIQQAREQNLIVEEERQEDGEIVIVLSERA
jgi:hypothetical protein